MGVAIHFDAAGTFRYWFYSDAQSGDEPQYPITGTWKWAGSVIVLSSSLHLYDTRWHIYTYQEEACLLADSARLWQAIDGKEHEDRLLFRITPFDEKHPFANRRSGNEQFTPHAHPLQLSESFPTLRQVPQHP